MRWVLALVIVAAAVAVVAGTTQHASAVSVNGQSLSMQELNAELTSISKSPSYQCYLEARAVVEGQAAPALAGATARTWSTDASMLWANIRATELSVDAYVQRHDPSAFSSANLALAKDSLENSITETLNEALSETQSEESEGAEPFSCPHEQGGAGTVDSLSASMAAGQVRAEAATLGLADLIAHPVPTSGAGLEAWFNERPGTFVTVCVADVVVSSESQATSLQTRIDDGSISIAGAARKYSIDTSARAKGGAIGCFSPNSAYWTSVQEYVSGLGLGQVRILSDSPDYAVLGPTSRHENSYASIAAAVASTAKSVNLQAEQLLATKIQSTSSISVNAALGTWQPTATGGAIAAPATPPVTSLLNSTADSPGA